MYDSSQILNGTSGLYGRIGLREPTRSGYTGILDATAKTTRSGKYYDYYHSLAVFPNIYDSQDDKSISSVNVNVVVASMQKEAIESGLQLVFDGEKDMMESKLLYANTNRLTDKITNNSKFVGYEITVPTDDRIAVILNNIILQFDSVGTFDLYLFHSSKKSYISKYSCTTIQDDFYSRELAVTLYSKASTYGGGKFYIGYFQNDLSSVSAYDRIWNDSSVMTKYSCMKIRSISATPNGTNMFDIDTVSDCTESWGINLDISTYMDYTSIILKNQSLFDNLQGYSFAIKVLELIKTTGRINITTESNKNLASIANYDLDDQTDPKSVGLYTKLRNEVKRVKLSLLRTNILIG